MLLLCSVGLVERPSQKHHEVSVLGHARDTLGEMGDLVAKGPVEIPHGGQKQLHRSDTRPSRTQGLFPWLQRFWLLRLSSTGCALGVPVGQQTCQPVEDRLNFNPLVPVGGSERAIDLSSKAVHDLPVKFRVEPSAQITRGSAEHDLSGPCEMI